MNTFLEAVACNAALAAILAALVFAATRFIKRPEVAYWLWMLVLVKLVTPPMVHLPVRLGTIARPSVNEDVKTSGQVALKDHSETAPAIAMPVVTLPALPPAHGLPDEEARFTSMSGPAPGHQAAAPPTPDAARAAQPSPVGQVLRDVPWTAALIALWLAGSACWCALATGRLLRFGRLIRCAQPAPASLQNAARELAERFGLRRCPHVRLLSGTIPPLLWWSRGRAVIVLPADLLNHVEPKGQKALLAHELAHYRRGDHLIRWAEAAVLGLYWWYPVAWWARRRLRRAEEQCCDAWVLWALPGEAKGYAHTLLTAAEFLCVSRPRLPAVAAGLEHVGSLKRRLEMIVKESLHRRMSWAGLIAVLMAALLVLPWSAGTVPAQAPGEDTDSATPQEATAAETAVEKPREAGPPSRRRRITGVVLRPDGTPLSGVQVYLIATDLRHPFFSDGLSISALPVERETEPWSGPKTVGRTQTNDAGRFEMPMEPPEPGYSPPGLVVVAQGFGLTFPVAPPVILRHDGGTVTRRKGSGDQDRMMRDLEIRLPATVPIRGQLLTPEGKAAEGVMVELLGVYAGDVLLSIPGDLAGEDLPEFWPKPARTDAEGSFTLTGMPADSLVFIRLTHRDFAPEDLTVDTKLSAAEEARASADSVPPTFSRELGPIRPIQGVVTAADTQKPLAGVLVDVAAFGRDGRGRSDYARTDEKGEYRVDSRAAHQYYLTFYPARDSGYLAAKRRHQGWPVGAEHLTIDARPDRGTVLPGRVLDDQTGEPIPGASIVYRPSKKNPAREKDYEFRHPVLTDETGRFTLTVPSGPGYLLVEAPEGPYLRSPDIGDMLPALFVSKGERIMPVGLTPIDVPGEGSLAEVVIRLRHGRTVILQAVGPDGEKLPSVAATWEGMGAIHDRIWPSTSQFPEGRVELSGLDPGMTARVLLIQKARKLGAAYDITPESPDGPVEVRMQPTGTIVGQGVTRDGKPAEDTFLSLKMSFDPKVSQFTREGWVARSYKFYSNFIKEYQQDDPPHPDGKFTLDYIVPGIPLGLAYGRSNYTDQNDIIALEPLKPGERRDIGKLPVDVVPGAPGRFAVDPQPFKEAAREGGRLEYIQAIPVLFLQGEPEEMGRQYGALLVDSMRPLIDLPKAIAGDGAGAFWLTVLQAAQGAFNRVPPRYARELDAAAKQANLSQKELDALTGVNGLFEAFGGGADGAALIVEPERSATGQMLFGRNLDLFSYGCLDRLTLVTICRPNGRHAFASVGFPGFGGVISGMNDAGLALSALSAYESNDNSPRSNPLGTPLYLTFRRILEECSTIEEAEKLLRGGSYTSRIILVACDTRNAAAFEITTKNVVARRAEDHLLAAANHFRTPELCVSKDSERYAKLQRYGRRQEPLTRADVAQAMRDVAESQTLHTMVFEPGSLQLHLAVGYDPPATARPLVTLDLAKLFQQTVTARSESGGR